MNRCKECGEVGDTPFLYIYIHTGEERRTCKDCWSILNRKLRVISHGPNVKRNKVVYRAVTVAGEPLTGQMELF